MSETEKHERQMKIIERKTHSKSSLGQQTSKMSAKQRQQPGKWTSKPSPNSDSLSEQSSRNANLIISSNSLQTYNDLAFSALQSSASLVSNLNQYDSFQLLPPPSFDTSSQVDSIVDEQIHDSPESLQRRMQNEDSQTMRKLLRKVKIIRESNYYQTKFHLLLIAQNSKKLLLQQEYCLLKYLTSIVQIMQAETIQELPTEQKCIDLIRIAEIVTFNFIKMCKKIYAFSKLNSDDQVTLVKSSVAETLILWSIMNINMEKECWEALVRTSLCKSNMCRKELFSLQDLERNFRFSLKLKLLKETNPKLYEEHRKFVLSFDQEWRFNDTLMSLLIVIVFFNPKRSELRDVSSVR